MRTLVQYIVYHIHTLYFYLVLCIVLYVHTCIVPILCTEVMLRCSCTGVQVLEYKSTPVLQYSLENGTLE